MRRSIDWEEIRLLYEVRGLPVAVIARQCGVSRESLYQHLRAEGWSRGLRQSVMNAAYLEVASTPDRCDDPDSPLKGAAFEIGVLEVDAETASIVAAMTIH